MGRGRCGGGSGMVIKHCFTDREAVGTVLALCLIFGMSRAAAGQSLPGQSSAMERLVPESSQHTFLKVDPTWVKQEEYLEPQGEESFRVVSRQRPDSKRRLFKQVSFFRIGAERDPSGYIKLVRYDPDGHLTQEVDQT